MSASSTLERPLSDERIQPARYARPPAWPAWAVLFASTSVVIGVLWDISWHSSIGRDTFWSPPHLAIYLGGIVAGVASGWTVLHTSFVAPPEQSAASVTFWKFFRGPLGAWACIWGAFAMLTSAPFDDWWHNAYGLDVKILSPPHAVLAMGILAIQLGALLMVLALQNRSGDDVGRSGAGPETASSLDPGPSRSPAGRRERVFRWMFGYAAGLVVLNFAVMGTEYTFRIFQHGTLFYQIVAATLTFPLVAAAVAGRLRWSATVAAASYMAVILTLHFILPLFPAEPKLAPVRSPVEQMIPPQFPLLLIAPALCMDLVIRHWRGVRGWLLACALATVFLLSFVAVQWPFADFLQSEYAHNAIFKQHLRPYMISPESLGARGEYYNPASGIALFTGLGIAWVLGVLSARIGLGAGAWMTRVRR